MEKYAQHLPLKKTEKKYAQRLPPKKKCGQHLPLKIKIKMKARRNILIANFGFDSENLTSVVAYFPFENIDVAYF